MAIFLSRIKRALNVGSKSITANGTYYASADGYDGYDEVTVNVSGGSATPITPSNANPVALSSGVAVEPTANGYAIQSYDNITPPSSPQAISSGDILKMIGNGYVIDTYSNATPSDSTPPQLSQGGIYIPTSNGYLYENQQGGSTETVLWTNNSPTSTFANQTVTLSDNISDYDYLCFEYRSTTGSSAKTSKVFVKTTDFITAGSGANTCQLGTYARNNSDVGYTRVATYASDTTITFSHSIRAGSSGQDDTSAIPTKIVGISVALPPSVGNVKTGTFDAGSAGTTITIDCGFEPTKIFVHFYAGTNSMSNVTYDSAMSDTKQISSVRTSSSNYSCAAYNIPNTNNNGVIASISSTGFVFRTGTATANKTCYYTAIG